MPKMVNKGQLSSRKLSHSNQKFEAHDARALQNNFRFERLNFFIIHGYPLNLQNPQTYSEKICVKKIFDRNPQLPIYADKLRVRDFVTSRIETAENNLLIPLLWSGDNPDMIPFDQLPGQFIVKANHGSRMNIIVRDSNYDRDKIIRKCHEWINTPFGVRRNEWAYQEIPRKIIIEKLIVTQKSEIPDDIKLYCFDGKVELIRVISGRFTKLKSAFFDGRFQRVDMRKGGQISSEIELPSNIEEMAEIAKKLSEKIDHIRVDLYSIDEKIYFGELTNYNASGRVKIKPRDMDYKLGKLWDLDRSHYRNIS